MLSYVSLRKGFQKYLRAKSKDTLGRNCSVKVSNLYCMNDIPWSILFSAQEVEEVCCSDSDTSICLKVPVPSNSNGWHCLSPLAPATQWEDLASTGTALKYLLNEYWNPFSSPPPNFLSIWVSSRYQSIWLCLTGTKAEQNLCCGDGQCPHLSHHWRCSTPPRGEGMGMGCKPHGTEGKFWNNWTS